MVWLGDDKAREEQYLVRAKPSLQFTAPVGVSVDGGEGPGAYGLNRNVELTVLIAKSNRVIANFALVQPSVTEGPMIAGELSKLVGLEAPNKAEFEKLAYPGRAMKRRPNMQKKREQTTRTGGDLRSMMEEMVASDATEEASARGCSGHQCLGWR